MVNNHKWETGPLNPERTDAMDRSPRAIILYLVVAAAAVAFGAVCYHSVEEIHYLKTFYPGEFTVEEAFYASAVELVKILIIGAPLVLVIWICLALLRKGDGGG